VDRHFLDVRNLAQLPNLIDFATAAAFAAAVAAFAAATAGAASGAAALIFTIAFVAEQSFAVSVRDAFVFAGVAELVFGDFLHFTVGMANRAESFVAAAPRAAAARWTTAAVRLGIAGGFVSPRRQAGRQGHDDRKE
jgi:hypothetical protein